MIAFAPWNPLNEMHALQNRLNTMLDSAFGRRGGVSGSLDWTGWTPSVDISEDDKEYVVRAELPGLSKKDVNVTFENGILNISGDRQQEKEQRGRRYHRVECSYGKFSRAFTLPGDMDPNQIKAEFKDGVLFVHVAKSESAKPKQIAVS